MACASTKKGETPCKARAVLRNGEWDTKRTVHTCSFDGTQETTFKFNTYLKELVDTKLGTPKDCHDKAKTK